MASSFGGFGKNVGLSTGPRRRDSVVHAPVPQPVPTEVLKDEEETGNVEAYESEEVAANYHDEEVAEAKLKLISKCRAMKKKELCEQKQLAACSSVELLCPTIWLYKSLAWRSQRLRSHMEHPAASGDANVPVANEEAGQEWPNCVVQ